MTLPSAFRSVVFILTAALLFETLDLSRTVNRRERILSLTASFAQRAVFTLTPVISVRAPRYCMMM
jgi:hypothetical protein